MQEKDDSTYGKISFRGCYLHPDRPATSKCTRCLRPSCFTCSKEYDGKSYCPTCFEAVKAWHVQHSPKSEDKARKRRPAAPVTGHRPTLRAAGSEALPIPPASARRSEALDVSQVTIDSKGNVTGGGSDAPPVTAAPPSGSVGSKPAPAAEEFSREQESGPDEAFRLTAEPARSTASESLEFPAWRTTEQVAETRESTTGQDAVPGQLAAGPTLANVAKAGNFKQAMSSLPIGIVFGVVVFGFWITLAVIRKQWTQISVLTVGIAIGWALFKGSGSKARLRRKAWRKPLPPAWAGVASVVVLGLLFPVAEYLAFKAVSPEVASSWHEFAALCFNTTGWVYVACGFALAFAVPFLLKGGKPIKALRKKKVSAGPAVFLDSAASREKPPASGPPNDTSADGDASG